MSRAQFPVRSWIHSRTNGKRLTHWTASIGFGVALTACGSDGGVLLSGSGGAFGSGGAMGTGGSALPSTGGKSSGGSASTGGAATTGGASTTGGAASTGGGSSTGGAPSTGGSTTTGGAGPTGGSDGTGGRGMSGGGPGTGGGSGTCEKGSTTGKEVLFIGESFIAMSSIPEETTKLAQAAGSLKSGDNYVDKSVSGTWIGNGASNSIPAQYKSNSSGVRFVLMNGGGNDCWQGGQASDRTNALNAAKQLFTDMDKNGVEQVVYFFYPDPIGSSFASLTACLDLLRPDMKAVCDAQVSPKCNWVDLRETWDGHSDYTSDGIHVAGPGNVPTATAIWNSMEENCVAP